MKQWLGIRSNVEVTGLPHQLKIKQENDGRCSVDAKSPIFISKERECAEHNSCQQHHCKGGEDATNPPRVEIGEAKRASRLLTKYD
ncbi:hypothetical protein GCM10011496_14450 [Polaromonas eurypsychrophila]|uniref:Uncharacterized protein n=1 Tax=Polaromonas eurypsychrophila TaxID=1614635 RepID=A0A916SDG4_9BURK|nr:hypothetical protein GCM10011496_14450 [Polaromonas eurypsychrophila]